MRFVWGAAPFLAAFFVACCVVFSPGIAHAGHLFDAPSSEHGVFIPVTSQSGDTVQLYAEEHGRGRPVLMLHGLGASLYTWRHLVPRLARKHRVITVDLKGFGRSEKPFDLAYSPHHHADLIVAFIRRTRLRDITLVGHSYGGAIALIVAEKLRAAGERRLRNMILMNAPAFPQKPTSFISFMKTPVVPYAVLTAIPPELATWLSLEPGNILRTSLEDIRAYARPFWLPAARHALITTARQIVPGNLKTIISGYRRLRHPALVIWCDGDTVVPLSTGKRLVRTLPNARLKVIKGCGHAPQDEQPAKLLSHVERFINRR